MPIRKHILIGTWKNKLVVGESVKLARDISKFVNSRELPFELSLSPSMVALYSVSKEITNNISLTAQNLIWDDTVSFTGETNGNTLIEIGCKYVIIGHSERRFHLGETDTMISKKIASAITHGLIPVLCVGENFESYQLGKSDEVVIRQLDVLKKSLNVNLKPPEFVIAYEPAWAISTSQQSLNCDPGKANAMHKLIRDVIRYEWENEFAKSLSILYGGSINPNNAANFFRQKEIDGGLVGKASQSKDTIIKIIGVAYEEFRNKKKK